MASNGTSTAPANGDSSIVEQMQRLHTEGHNPTVEDVVDEEDIEHPPPSAEAPLSEKAKGKQPAKEDTKPAAAKLDTSNEEAFPALGAGPKKAAAGAWGGGKPASMAANGGPRGPPSAIPTGRTPAATARPGSGLNLPGKQQQTLVLNSSQMLSPSERKKPIERILADIEKKAGIKLDQRPTANGLQFIATGRPEKLQPALQLIARELGSRQTTAVQVPVSVKPHLIGKGGANIKQIQEKTGARIQVPKSDPSVLALGDDDDATIDVTIEGDAVAAEQARQMVEKIINERTSNLATAIRDIAPEAYPFIAGPRNANVEKLINGRNVDVKIPTYNTRHTAAPQLVTGQPMQFSNHPHSHIRLSGDRQEVQQVRAEIERQAAELRSRLAFEELTHIPRGQHQLVFDEDALHDLLEETGCTVILPAENEDTEAFHIIGPADRIVAGRDRIDELAGSMSANFVDLGRSHPGSTDDYRRNLARYLQQRSALREFENRHNSRIALPRDNSSAWELYGKNSKDVMNARRELTNLIDAHPPQRFMPVDLDPFFHQHLREEHASRLRHDHGVHLLFPEDADQQLILVFEQPGTPPAEFVTPRQKPAAAELQAFQKALREVQKELLGLTQQHGPIESRGVDVPRQYQDKVRKFVNRQQQELPQGSLPLQFVSPTQQSPQVTVRGPQSRLDPISAAILEFIEQEKRDELERGHTQSFDFPQKFASHVIGRGGEGINKLRDEFDVEIQVRDGKVELKGPQAKCAAAQQRIQNMAKRLEDETTHVIKVPRSYHPELIGAKGSQVNRLQDRYKVRVQFPRSTPIHDDESVADSEPRSRGNQAPDEINIRGPKKGADEARDELLSLFQYIKDTSQVATVSLAKAQLPSIIGAGGREIEKIRQQTGAKVDVPNKDEVNADGRVEIQLKGTKKQVEDAKKLLSERAKDFDDRISQIVSVPKKYLQGLIGSGGNNIRGIMIAAGVPDDRQELARAVRFPDAKSESTEVKIEQKKAVAEKIVRAIEEFVKTRENQVADTVEVPIAQHKVLIGQQGQTRRALEEQFKVQIDIPRQGSGSTAVKVAGLPENVAKAKEHIAGMIKQEDGVEIAVPRHLHHAIADNGRFFGRLRNNHGVRVDHGRPPPKPESSKPKRRAGAANGAMPLITDDAPGDAAESGHSWEIVDAFPTPEAEPAHIGWVLRGKKEDVEKAHELIKEAIAAAQEQDSAGYLVLGDPSLHKLVIGQGGATINSIRNDTGCKITVPKSGGADEAIEILGRKEGVEEAKERILEAVAKGGRGGRRERD